MDIQPPNRQNKINKNQGNIKNNEVDSISITHLGQKVDINPQDLHKACSEAAKNAYNIGETNDEEEYEEEMEEVLEEVLYKKAGKNPPPRKTKENK